MADPPKPTSSIPRLSRLPIRSSIPNVPSPRTINGGRPTVSKTEGDPIKVQRLRPKPSPSKPSEPQGPQTKLFVKPLSTLTTSQRPGSNAPVSLLEESGAGDNEGPQDLKSSQEAPKSAARKPRPSLSDRAIQTLSHIPPSPSPRRRQSGFFPTDSTAIRPPSSLGRNRPITSAGFYPPLPSSRPTSPSKRPGPAKPSATIATRKEPNHFNRTTQARPSNKQESAVQTPSAKANFKSALKSSAALRETIANAKAVRRAAAKYENDDIATPVVVNSSLDCPKIDNVEDELHVNPLRKRINSARGNGKLNISGMRLKVFPEEVLKMYELNSTTDGPTWYESVDLTRLNAADNELEDLRGWYGLGPSLLNDSVEESPHVFSYLQTLDVHGNRLQSLPSVLTHFEHLSVLNLSRNQLTDTMREIFSIISFIDTLRELNLAENQFTGAFPSLSNLRSLELLDIHSNNFTNLPEELSDCRQLRKLDISKNKITSLPRLDLPNLTTLNLCFNQIPIDGLMTNLTAPQLTTLDVSTCRIDKLPPLRSNFPSLTTVIAFDNRITSLDVECVRGLEMLDLKGNDLRSLPPELSLLQLKKLLVSGNPMRAPRREILEGTTERLMEWLKGRLPAGVGADEMETF
ncbi:MAG: hypothetical protein Q9166_007448 [cf. Caloplaca sp. 2 TL-2023]